MEKWEEFEIDCTNYLNKTYGNYFKHMGFSDSTTSDIRYEKEEDSFLIEAKMSSAQSGQFVLIPDYKKQEFIFSPRNKSKLDDNVEFIINHMNDNFIKYKNVGTRGEDINISQEVFSDLIVNTYKEKGVEFLITKGRDFIIFPIEKYCEYFKISAKFREKKSGSSNVPKSRQKEVIAKLNDMDIEYELLDDFLIKSLQELDKNKFSIQDSNYMFSRYKENVYRIRKLSNTRNPNVIFSIKLLKEQEGSDLEKFKSRLCYHGMYPELT